MFLVSLVLEVLVEVSVVDFFYGFDVINGVDGVVVVVYVDVDFFEGLLS